MITRAQIEKLGALHAVESTMLSLYLAVPPSANLTARAGELIAAASTVVPAWTLLGRLDHDLLDLVFLLGLEADGDGEDAVVVARLHVVRVGVARQRQAAGERAVAE